MLNHSVMNKKYGDQIKKKTVDKKNGSSLVNPLHRSMDCYKIIDSSILQEIFSSISECFSCNGEKTELR